MSFGGLLSIWQLQIAIPNEAKNIDPKHTSLAFTHSAGLTEIWPYSKAERAAVGCDYSRCFVWVSLRSGHKYTSQKFCTPNCQFAKYWNHLLELNQWYLTSNHSTASSYCGCSAYTKLRNRFFLQRCAMQVKVWKLRRGTACLQTWMQWMIPMLRQSCVRNTSLRKPMGWARWLFWETRQEQICLPISLDRFLRDHLLDLFQSLVHALIFMWFAFMPSSRSPNHKTS